MFKIFLIYLCFKSCLYLFEKYRDFNNINAYNAMHITKWLFDLIIQLVTRTLIKCTGTFMTDCIYI